MSVRLKHRSAFFKHFSKGSFLGFLWIGLLSACITPVDLEPEGFNDILVVNGFITDQPGPHRITLDRLSRFVGVREEGGTRRFEENARVRIIDDQGNVTPVERVLEVQKRVFNADPFGGCLPAADSIVVQSASFRTPSGFTGVVGRSYTLEVVTQEGRTYRSTPQLILPTPPIDSIGLEFKVLPAVNTPRSGVEIYAAFQDPVGENFYFWQYNGIYRIDTPPSPDPDACCLYDPADDGEDECWILERNVAGNQLAVSDRLFDGQNTRQLAGMIEDNGLRFANGKTPTTRQYYVELFQYNMSQEAFNYNERILDLAEINGEVFDPPPLSVGGNLTNVENPDDPIIGFFGAFSVQKAEIFIDRDILTFLQPFPGPCGDCRVRAGAQVEIPEPYRR